MINKKLYFWILVLAGFAIMAFGSWITLAGAVVAGISGMQHFGADLLPGLLISLFGILMAGFGLFKAGKISIK